MRLTWLGHACFLFEEDGYRLVLDPYDAVDGYPLLQTRAHEVLCSHEHHDHNNRDAVTMLSGRTSPFTIRCISTFHDGEKGALRGKNTVHVIESGNIRVVHLGDLGHLLTAEQTAQIGRCDVILMPVGGTYTVDGDEAAAVVKQLGGGTVVPMHYRFGSVGYAQISTLDAFLRHFRPEQIVYAAENCVEAIPVDGTKVVILKFTADREY